MHGVHPGYGYAVQQRHYLITVPTPSDANGRFSNAYVEAVLDRIAGGLKAKKTFHVVALVSTVMPTTCEHVFVPILEKLTGKVCGRDFGFVYNPEFVALGSVIHDFLHPDMLLIGASDERSAQLCRELYSSVVENDPYYAVMNLTNAEITKLSLNCYVTMKISFANELALICERIPGADVDVVTTAVGADTRVGRRYLKGGLGFGGPCFPRDNLAFQRCAEDAGSRRQPQSARGEGQRRSGQPAVHDGQRARPARIDRGAAGPFLQAMHAHHRRVAVGDARGAAPQGWLRGPHARPQGTGKRPRGAPGTRGLL